MLDRSKPFATVSGYDPNLYHLYEQGGRFYDQNEYEVNPKTGKRLEQEVASSQPKKEPEKSNDEYVGLAWGDEPETAPRLVTVDYEGDLIPVDLDESSYDTPADIRKMLDKLGAEYSVYHKRHILWDKLMKRVEELS